MIGISFLVTTHNEGVVYLKPLFRKLISLLKPEDEIIILDDFSDDQETLEIINKFAELPEVTLYNHRLDNDFAAHKNYGKSKCTKPYVMQIDGDENFHDNLVLTLPETLLLNPTVDLFRVPRINVVHNLTPELIAQWGWQVNEQGWVNWPDAQDRIIKNIPKIQWVNLVHEKITGHLTHADLPAVEDYCLLHIKSILRQEMQQELYSTIIK